MEIEEFDNIELDKINLYGLRNVEQFRRHSIDKNLERIPVERAIHLLTKGDEIQKLSVIQTLPSLLAEDPEACIQRLIPMMQQTLPTASTEFHAAASSAFKTILEQRLVSNSVFTRTFLQKILNLLSHKEQIVANTWLEILPVVINLLPIDVVARKILPVAINKGQLSQSVDSRIICCKLLGSICTKFDSQMIKKDVLPTIHSLCQDENSGVRACICLQLHFVAEGLGPESAKFLLLSLIIELANDEEAIVRQAFVQTIVHLLPHFQTDVLRTAIARLFKKLCENSLEAFDDVLCIITEEYGKIVIGLEKCLMTSERIWFLKYFQQLAQLGTEKHMVSAEDYSVFEQVISTDVSQAIINKYSKYRRWCAFNIPAMFLFASSIPEDLDILLSTFSALAYDQYDVVKCAIACGIHEVAKLLGPKCHSIKNVFIKLLNEGNTILIALIPHIAQILELLIQGNQTTETEREGPLITELGVALLKCEKKIFTSNIWRSSKLMLEQLEILPKLFPSEYIHTKFVPVAFERALTTKPMPVRLAAGRLVLVLTRYNLKSQQRSAIRNKIYTDFARNQSSYVRILFLRMMIEAMEIFSSNYFKEHFYSIVLSLSTDLIANIRLKLVTLLPTLKSYLRLPSDKMLLSTFESSVRNLVNNEKDRDVLFALSYTIRELDKMDIRHESQPITKLSKQDLEDLRKFKGEKELEAMAGEKSSPIGQLAMTVEKGLSISGRANVSDGMSAHCSKQSTVDEGPSKSSLSTSQKVKQTGVTESVTESSFKVSRQVTGLSRGFDPSKSSTSSDSLTSSWVRLTSNRALLTQLWEKLDQSESTNSSCNPTNTNIDDCDDFIFNMPCGCSNTPNFVYPNPSTLESESNRLNLTSSCSCDSLECKETFHSFFKHNYFDSPSRASPLRLTHTKEPRHEHIHNYFLPSLSRETTYDDTNSPNFAALRAVTNAAQYNSCWAFSSMPEIPVTLLDDEFLVDTGVRIPAQLSSSQSTSKIPNLQDIIYRNTRIGNKFDKCNKTLYTSKDLGERLTNVDQKGNRLSGNFDSRFTSKVQMRDSLKDKRYSVMSPKPHSNSETSQSKGLDDKSKRSSFTMGREVNRHLNYISVRMRINSDDKRFSTMQTKTRSNSESSQSNVLDDKTKRSSYASDRDVSDKFKKYTKTGMAVYDNVGTDTKYSMQNFKRHSVECVGDYAPVNRMNRLKRNFTLDVNHNQGTSKIPLRKSIAFGSRTAPVTRASSPIRWGPQLSFETDHQPTKYPEPTVSSCHSSDDDTDDVGYEKFTGSELSNLKKGNYTKDWLNELPSDIKDKSSKELDKLCSKFEDVANPTTYTKEECYVQEWISKLPVWNPNVKKNL